MNAEIIVGPDSGWLKDKKVQPPPCQDSTILDDLSVDKKCDDALCGDVMFVNTFIVTKSSHVNFSTEEMLLLNSRCSAIMKGIKQVHGFYQHRGFRIIHIFIDGEFESLCRLLHIDHDNNVCQDHRSVLADKEP